MDTSTNSVPDAQSLILRSIADHIKQRLKENPHLISCAYHYTVPRSIEIRYEIVKEILHPEIQKVDSWTGTCETPEGWWLPPVQQATSEPQIIYLLPKVVIAHVITLQSDRLMIATKCFVGTTKCSLYGRGRETSLDIYTGPYRSNSRNN
jgi:hypothetical protein